jgi:hypothetical protein
MAACTESPATISRAPARSATVPAADGALFTKMPADFTGIRFENRIVESQEMNVFVYRNFYNGGGVAAALIGASAQEMTAKGYTTLYARIWHSNGPSQSAFARAVWRRVGWLLQINPLRRPQPWNLKLRR